MRAPPCAIGDTLISSEPCRACARARAGEVWPARPSGGKDAGTGFGHAPDCDGEAGMCTGAPGPTMLDLYRRDPAAVRQAVEQQAGRARNRAIRAFFVQLFT